MGWGYQPERLQAGIAIMIYTIVGSLPLLISLLIISSWSFDTILLPVMQSGSRSFHPNLFASLALLGFLVKFPIFTLHLWLPKAHVEAPVVGSIILAALLLKLGGYGIWRLLIVCPNTTFLRVVQAFRLLGGAVVAILCIRQTDIKVIIAYSSISHIRIVIACVLRGSKLGAVAAFLLIVSHGVSSSAMFAGANIIYSHSHSRNILLINGLLRVAPYLRLM
jgi:NADH-ubiquinone oxidoreductase chain 4